jgi:hypothetical protein
VNRLPARGAGALVVALLLGACVSTPRHKPQQPVAAPSVGSAGTGSIEGYASAIKAVSDRSDHESDAKARADLATEATNNADACLAIAPHAAACQYGKALATGLEARAHPGRAVGLLGSMLESLAAAEKTDPDYDKAGPARVAALVLIRAPGWPLGPGDIDAGLAAAQRAVALQPDYPPNILALAEARAKTGDASGARENYARARDVAQALPSGPERDDWLRDAAEGLRQR